MKIDIDNPVVKRCVEGTQAEFQGSIDKARALYQQAWDSAQDDYEACIAAHYVARHQEDLGERLRWNQIALEKADAVADDRVQDFYPSLFLNMGQSHELLGNLNEARRYYDLSAKLGLIHSIDRSG